MMPLNDIFFVALELSGKSSKDAVPGVSKVPILGKMFQGNQKSDKLNELLVFIAPRIL